MNTKKWTFNSNSRINDFSKLFDRWVMKYIYLSAVARSRRAYRLSNDPSNWIWKIQMGHWSWMGLTSTLNIIYVESLIFKFFGRWVNYEYVLRDPIPASNKINSKIVFFLFGYQMLSKIKKIESFLRRKNFKTKRNIFFLNIYLSAVTRSPRAYRLSNDPSNWIWKIQMGHRSCMCLILTLNIIYVESLILKFFRTMS